jgi:GTP-binding protein HflX
LDITHPQAERQAEAVFETLEEIGTVGKPIVTALNKIDRLADQAVISPLVPRFPNSVPISASTGAGLEALLACVEGVLEDQMTRLDVLVPYEMGELVDLFHRRGLIEMEDHSETGTRIMGRIPRALAGRFSKWRLGATND